MIGSLSGRLSEKQPSRLVIDVQGVGYDVQVPLSTFYGLGEIGTQVALRIHTHVREDALALFGFATRLELDLFERLIAISGVGPRLALAVLSGIEPPGARESGSHWRRGSTHTDSRCWKKDGGANRVGAEGPPTTWS